jgi:integrase
MNNIMEMNIAKQFLESMARNSKSSKHTYAAGLTHFERFLNQTGKTLQDIIKPLSTDAIDRYKLLNDFVAYLQTVKNENNEDIGISLNSINVYVAVVRSFFGYNDIDIIPSKFKRKVKLPKLYREDEEAIDATDIREILLACNHKCLKPYLLVLASGGRAIETCAIRKCDIDFNINPTMVHIRKDFTKTRRARDIYISDEATKYLKRWIQYNKQENGTELVFASQARTTAHSLYQKMRQQFNKVLTSAKLDSKKEGMQRRKITLHSFRRFVKGVLSDQVGQDYSEWFLGHAKSSYWTKKEPYRRELYSKCMKYLTFLDYSTFEATGKNIEAKLSEKENEIQLLRQRDQIKDQELQSMKEHIQAIEQSQRQSFEEFKQENRHIIAEAMAKYTAQLPKKALERFRKPIIEVLEEG